MVAHRYSTALLVLILFWPSAHAEREKIGVVLSVIGSDAVSALADDCMRSELRKLRNISLESLEGEGAMVDIVMVAIRQKFEDDGSWGDQASLVAYAQILPLRVDVVVGQPLRIRKERGMWWEAGPYDALDVMCKRIVGTIDAVLIEQIRVQESH